MCAFHFLAGLHLLAPLGLVALKTQGREAKLEALLGQAPGGFEALRSTVVRIASYEQAVSFFRPFARPRTMGSIGSGFAVEAGGPAGGGPAFVTNAHVVKDASVVMIQLPDLGQTYFDAYVPIICEEFDLAIVQLSNPKEIEAALEKQGLKLKPLRVERVPVKMGTEVAAIGFPLGSKTLKLSRGIIAGTETINSAIYLQSTASISPGNSGGPLLSLDGLRVLGVNSATSSSSRAQNINYVMPSLHIVQLINEFKRLGAPLTTGAFLQGSRSDSPVVTFDKAKQTSRAVTSIDAAERVLQEAKQTSYAVASVDAERALQGASSGAGADADGEGHPHVQMRIAPINSVDIEASDAIYSSSGGCTKGVFLSRVHPWSALRFAEPPLPAKSFVVSVEGAGVDSYGLGQSPIFLGDHVPFENLFQMRDDIRELVTVVTCSKGKQETHKVSMIWRPEYQLGIHRVEEPRFEAKDLDFEVFAGVTVMQMTTNHIQMLLNWGRARTLGRWLLGDNRVEPRLMISHVAKGTYGDRVLNVGMAVDKLNGKKVRTLQDFRANFVPGDDVWQLETDLQITYAVDFKHELAKQLEDSRRSSYAKYLLTPAVRAAQDAATEHAGPFRISSSAGSPLAPFGSPAAFAAAARAAVAAGDAGPLEPAEPVTLQAMRHRHHGHRHHHDDDGDDGDDEDEGGDDARESRI